MQCHISYTTGRGIYLYNYFGKHIAIPKKVEYVNSL